MIRLDYSAEANLYEIETFCDGHGIKLQPLDIYHAIQRQVNSLFGLRADAEFPGSRPTVLSRENFTKITSIQKAYRTKVAQGAQGAQRARNPFFVTEKTDGKRMYLFFCTFDYSHKFQVAIDTKYNMRLVYFDVPGEFYEGTLFDGELVQDFVEDEGKLSPHYVFYVFDCLQSMGTPMTKQWFSDRLFVASKLLEMMKLVKTEMVQSPFQIKLKHFFPLHEIQRLLSVSQPHPSDGLIVSQNEAIASCFHCPYTHKWKPLPFITMDFLLFFCLIENVEMCYFFTRKNKKAVFRQIWNVTFRDCSAVDAVPPSMEDGKKLLYDRLCSSILRVPKEHFHLQVVECFYCNHERLWKPKKIRHDKEHPNSLKVLQDTVQIMKKPIHLSDLIMAWK